MKIKRRKFNMAICKNSKQKAGRPNIPVENQVIVLIPDSIKL